MDLFLSPLISTVVEKAATSLMEQFCRMRGMDDNRKKLHLHLLGIQKKIADAERRGEDDPAVLAWMNELQRAALKAVDVLDEFQYDALRENAIAQLPSSSTKVIKGCFSSENAILFRYKMSNKMTELLGHIDEIINKMNKFNFTPRDPIRTIDRETDSSVMESEVIGREGEKEATVNALLDTHLERENVSVLAIVAMGGMGKTTLAQLVYNDEKVKKRFELLLWVCVSKDFNVINIVKSIIELATNGGASSTSNKEMLQRRLREVLDNKRYLLVLDDVWNVERVEWEDLKTLLVSRACPGSVIIVTTRIKSVASIVGTLRTHDLASLNEEDSWKLFQKRAFNGADEEQPEELIKFGNIIVEKCAGLPLALKVMGGLMRSKQEVHEWRDVAESKTWERVDPTNGILPALKLSYDELPSYLKQCFAFCAIFPQDYAIERETLIQLWMANDFISTEGTMDLEEKGLSIFNELYSRSFFQDIKEEVNFGGLQITCKMHDLMHDLATQIARKKCCSALEVDHLEIAEKEIQHLSVPAHKSPGINSIPKHFPVIRTYLVDGRQRYQKPDKNSYLLKSSSLRALKFQSNIPLPKELGYMKHLRYLDLSDSELDALPDTITTLYNLQTLKLSGTNIHELPENMRCMINLRHLFIDRCYNLKRMPIGLGQLKNLRTLTDYVADSGQGRTIAELNNLNLCGRLHLSGLETVRSGDAKAVNLAKKTNIYALLLEWGTVDGEGTTENNQPVLEALIPHNKLKLVSIKGYGGSSFPKWLMESLTIKNLKALRLTRCFKCKELPPVSKLPLLEELSLWNMESLICIVGGESLATFTNLEELELSGLPNLESWHEKDPKLVQFPKLKELFIWSCPKLKTLPVHAFLLNHLSVRSSSEIKLHHISNLPMLSHLDISNQMPPEAVHDQSFPVASLRRLTIWENDWFLSSVPAEPAVEFWKNFASLETLGINSCDALVFWPEEAIRSLHCLKKLQIYWCKELTGSSQASSSHTPCGEDALPHLKTLEFLGCPNLVVVPSCYKSLRGLVIIDCPKLSYEGLSELTNFTELETLELRDCTNLRALPDGMEQLTSLKTLSITGCPRIESFPDGFQERLSALRRLEIDGCPALERLCGRGGDYWDLISSIPEMNFPPEAPKSDNFLRRCLPI